MATPHKPKHKPADPLPEPHAEVPADQTVSVPTSPPVAPKPGKLAPNKAVPHTPIHATIHRDTFTPPTITAKVGQKIVWTNGDTQDHSVTFEPLPTGSKLPALVSSVAIPATGRFEYTFAAPGRYPYFCSNFPEIKGEVVVTA